jgi:hypothetical protein
MQGTVNVHKTWQKLYTQNSNFITSYSGLYHASWLRMAWSGWERRKYAERILDIYMQLFISQASKQACMDAYYISSRHLFCFLSNLIRGRSGLPCHLHFSGHLSRLMQCRGCKKCDMGQPIVAPIYRASRYRNDNACGVQGLLYSIPSLLDKR